MIRVSRGEFWLLGAVIEFPVWISPLANAKPEDLAAHYNRQYHGLTPDQLCDSLANLADNGWIECSHSSSYEVDDSFRPTRQELKSALIANEADEQSWLAYRLTTEGGEAWEEFVRPDWNRFLGYSEGDGVLELMALNRTYIEKFARLGNGVRFRMIPGSEVWTTKTPCKLLYWKEVLAANCLTLNFETDPDGSNVLHGERKWTSHEAWCVDWWREHQLFSFNEWFRWR